MLPSAAPHESLADALLRQLGAPAGAVASGLPFLDDGTPSSLRPSHLYEIIGESCSGKSMLAQQALAGALLSSCPVLAAPKRGGAPPPAQTSSCNTLCAILDVESRFQVSAFAALLQHSAARALGAGAAASPQPAPATLQQVVSSCLSRLIVCSPATDLQTGVEAPLYAGTEPLVWTAGALTRLQEEHCGLSTGPSGGLVMKRLALVCIDPLTIGPALHTQPLHGGEDEAPLLHAAEVLAEAMAALAKGPQKTGFIITRSVIFGASGGGGAGGHGGGSVPAGAASEVAAVPLLAPLPSSALLSALPGLELGVPPATSGALLEPCTLPGRPAPTARCGCLSSSLLDIPHPPLLLTSASVRALAAVTATVTTPSAAAAAAAAAAPVGTGSIHPLSSSSLERAPSILPPVAPATVKGWLEGIVRAVGGPRAGTLGGSGTGGSAASAAAVHPSLARIYPAWYGRWGSGEEAARESAAGLGAARASAGIPGTAGIPATIIGLVKAPLPLAVPRGVLQGGSAGGVAVPVTAVRVRALGPAPSGAAAPGVTLSEAVVLVCDV